MQIFTFLVSLAFLSFVLAILVVLFGFKIRSLRLQEEKFYQENKILEEKIRELTTQLEKVRKENEERIAQLNLQLKQKTEQLTKLEETISLPETDLEYIYTVFHYFPEAIILLDQNQKIIYLNPKSADLIGESQTEVKGKKLDQLLLNNIGVELQKIISSIKHPFERHDLALQDNFILEVSCVILELPNHRKGYLLVLRDVTRERLVEKMKNEFVALAAHQLRTPLSAIKWTLKMFLEGEMGKITKEQAEILEKGYRSNEHMIRLINELLEITRIEEGRYIEHPVETHLEPLVESVVNSFKEEAEQKGVSLVYKKPTEPLPKVRIDTEKIRQVIINLIDNAIRYNKKGGKVTITLKYVTKKIDDLTGEKWIECEVKDTGIGIPKDQQRRIFERFFRGSNAIRKETEGSGLGLYISKNIIEAHEGRLWFESEEGKGSTFIFSLPVVG